MRAACCVGLALIASLAQSAAADPIHFSTSGQFELSTGTVALSGVSNVQLGELLRVGSIPLTEGDEAQSNTPFQIRFDFDGGLPSIEVTGTIGRVNYNSNEFIGNPVVTTSATAAQIDLYPTVFQDMIAHPEWIRTTSYTGYLPETDIFMGALPFDPNEAKNVPEPSTALVFVAGLVGLAGWGRRRKKD